MHFSTFAYAVAGMLLAGSAMANDPFAPCDVYISNTTAGKYTLCGAQGSVNNPQVYTTFPGEGNNSTCLYGCKAAGVSKCLSYSYDTTSDTCKLYSNTIINMGYNNNTKSSTTFWSTYCFTQNVCGFYLQADSNNANIDFDYVRAQNRTPTFGSVLVASKALATRFMLNQTTGQLYAFQENPNQIAEQSVGQDTGRVFFATNDQLSGSGYAPLNCVLGTPNVNTNTTQLVCTSQNRSNSYGCTGTGPQSGWFIGNSNPYPSKCAAAKFHVIS